MTWESLLAIYLIVATRLLLPLLIPRYPLPGVLACMVLDSLDQSIIQAFGVDPPWYQGYDKALDIYYLAIAYLATMRNWENVAAFHVGRALFYYRLAGVLAFELTGLRSLLAIFPNVFEAFFVYYELVRRKGDPLRLTRNVMLVVVAIIWFVVKLPHEWWIHIAKLDATDFIKTEILGASPDTSFARAIIEAPVIIGALILIAAIVALVIHRWAKPRWQKAAQKESSWLNRVLAPWRRPADATSTSTITLPAWRSRSQTRVMLLRRQNASKLQPTVLLEKIILVGIISVIFQQILPDLRANGVRTALFVTAAIVATDFVWRWTVRRFKVPFASSIILLVTAVFNFFFVLLFQLIIPFLRPGHGVQSALIFASLITLFVTLYDYHRPIYDLRHVQSARASSVTKSGA